MAKKFQKNWNVPLVFLERTNEQDLMEFIWTQNVGDIDLKLFSAAENSNNFQKTSF